MATTFTFELKKRVCNGNSMIVTEIATPLTVMMMMMMMTINGTPSVPVELCLCVSPEREMLVSK